MPTDYTVNLYKFAIAAPPGSKLTITIETPPELGLPLEREVIETMGYTSPANDNGFALRRVG